MSDINLTDLFAEAIRLENVEREEEESGKRDILRGGNSGVLLSDKSGWKVAGTCHRKTILRANGIQEVPDFSTSVMFAGGFANEEIWLTKLRRSWPGTILTEEDIPISWTTETGRKVTGRPDIVLCDKDQRPQLGIELKMVASKWTAKDVFYSNKPKFPHLIQAAHYMWQLDIPWRLAYTQFSLYHIGNDAAGWETKMYPKEGQPESEYVEYATYDNKGKSRRSPKKLKTRIKVYELRFGENNLLEFRVEGSGSRWTSTVITSENISDYYHYVHDLLESRQLGSRPVNIDYTGEKLRWSMCDKQYCTFSEACDRHENDYTKWLEATVNLAKLPGTSGE